MNDTINTIIDTATQSIQDAATKTVSASDNLNIWFLIAVVEFFVIVFLLYVLIKKRKQNVTRQEIIKETVLKEGEIDFNNTLKSAFGGAQKIYDELKVKCHPDRFPNDDIKQKIADELFQQITQNKNNYKKLLELKKIAKQDLNINF